MILKNLGDKRRLIIFTASRSERGLLEPIIRRCNAEPTLDTTVHTLDPKASLTYIKDDIQKTLSLVKPDVALVPCDRREMVPAAALCQTANIPVFHLYAGVGVTDTVDDEYRYLISLHSAVLLCESLAAKKRLIQRDGFTNKIIHVVGCTHFDDLTVDESLCPKHTYDLILVNPSSSKAETIKNLCEVIQWFNPSIHNIFIGPNEDPFSEEIN